MTQEKFGYKGGYGLEITIDLKGCDLSNLSKERIRTFFVGLCDRIHMTRYGEPYYWEDDSEIPHLKGISGFQFIRTSNIVCHALPMLNAVYLNIFSCKEFDTEDTVEYCMEFWGATSEAHTVVART